MRAKFIYEGIGDILKGKSEEDIISSMEDPDDLLEQSLRKDFLPGVKKALEMGANVHANNDWVLLYASNYGYIDIVELLLKNGANVHAQNDYALRYASENGHINVVKLLKKYI